MELMLQALVDMYKLVIMFGQVLKLNQAVKHLIVTGLTLVLIQPHTEQIIMIKQVVHFMLARQTFLQIQTLILVDLYMVENLIWL